MAPTLMQLQSDKIRNVHRLSEIRDAQADMEQLEGKAKAALNELLKEHGLRLGEFSLNVSLGKMPSLGAGPVPSGYINATLVAE
jgi:hypothetical protein